MKAGHLRCSVQRKEESDHEVRWNRHSKTLLRLRGSGRARMPVSPRGADKRDQERRLMEF